MLAHITPHELLITWVGSSSLYPPVDNTANRYFFLFPSSSYSDTSPPDLSHSDHPDSQTELPAPAGPQGQKAKAGSRVLEYELGNSWEISG